MDEKLEKFKKENNYVDQKDLKCCLTCKFCCRVAFDEDIYCELAGFKEDTYYGLVDYLGRCDSYKFNSLFNDKSYHY